MSFFSRSSNYEVAELTWENGQLAMHDLSGMLPTKPAAWGRDGSDTLESLVHQATTSACHHKQQINSNGTGNSMQEREDEIELANAIDATTSIGKWGENPANMQIPQSFEKKRMRSESDQCETYLRSRRVRDQEGAGAGGGAGAGAERRACASASATFCREQTWVNSFESPRSLKTKTTYEDSASHDASENGDEENEIKRETVQSHSARRSRAAAVHTQSERRRRDRINQKMKDLQKLVPNASKTDKASMLDEVIQYLKQLQAEVQMLSTRTMPKMMMNPLAMQQQLQMSLLARMGMGVGLGMGMGMLDMNPMARAAPQWPLHQSLIHATPVACTTPTFVPPQFILPPAAIPTCNRPPANVAAESAAKTAVPFAISEYGFLPQNGSTLPTAGKPSCSGSNHTIAG